MANFQLAERKRLLQVGETAPHDEGNISAVLKLQDQLRALIFAREPIPKKLQSAFHPDRLATLIAAYEAERDEPICERCQRPKIAGDFGCT